MSIQVNLNGLSFCALLEEKKEIIFFKKLLFQKKLSPTEILQQIEKIYSEEEFLQKKIDEVKVLFSNELYSLVPQKYFEEENISHYLKFNTKILETDFVAHDILNTANVVNVYVPYSNITNFFFDKYGEFEYMHSVSVLIEGLLDLPDAADQQPVVYLNNYRGGYDLIIIRDKKLIFSNSFHCETKEDFIYYLLFTAEQLELDPSEFKLKLLGHIAPNSDYYKIAYTFIRNIEFLETTFGYTFNAVGERPQSFEFFTLLKSLR